MLGRTTKVNLLVLVVGVAVLLFWSCIERPMEAPADTVDVARKDQPLRPLRYLALGTSRTWGTRLEDPNSQAFVKLLSPDGVNLAVPAADADMPALCIYSMLQDCEQQVFDVILLEFKADYSLLPFQRKLVFRLRTRFPKALIIFIEIRPLFYYEHKPTNRTIRDWMLDYGFSSLHDQQFHNSLLTNTTAADWKSTTFDTDWKERRAVMVDYGGAQILSFPPNQHLDDPRKFVTTNAEYFFDDWSHPSVVGHEYIAEQILRIVAQSKIQQHLQGKNDDDDGVWIGEKDCCDSWFKGGGQGILYNHTGYSVRGVQGMELVEFDTYAHKFAVEVSQSGGSIQMYVPMTPSDIFVAYMQVGTKINQYPRTSAWVVYDGDVDDNGDDDNATSSRNSTPVKLDPYYKYDAHVVNVAYIAHGPKKQGNITIHFQPLEKGMAHPFRVTGTIVSPHDDSYLERMSIIHA